MRAIPSLFASEGRSAERRGSSPILSMQRMPDQTKIPSQEKFISAKDRELVANKIISRIQTRTLALTRERDFHEHLQNIDNNRVDTIDFRQIHLYFVWCCVVWQN